MIGIPRSRARCTDLASTPNRIGACAFAALASSRQIAASAQVRIAAGSEVQSEKSPLLTLQRVIRFQLEFNQLLVTNSQCPYSVETGPLSMNPLEGYLFLDGYIW